MYAVGMHPGSSDVKDWTITTDTSVNVTGLSLTSGWTYYVSVKAENRVGLWSDVGSSDGITVVPRSMTMRAAKECPTSVLVNLTGCLVTAVFTGEFYAESSDRSCGIRVESSDHVYKGEVVRIVGDVSRDDVEPYITNATVTETGQAKLRPVFMTGRSLGGGGNTVVPGPTNGVGLNNVGMLVAIVGRVRSKGSACIYIDDGSGIYDGVRNLGVPVRVNAPQNFREGSYVKVVGISSLDHSDEYVYNRMILTESDSDITPVVP
jgi:uncharacterized protein YdeI (BOF family)